MATKKTLIQIRLEEEEVARIDQQVNRTDRKAWEPRMTRTMFIRKAIHNELAGMPPEVDLDFEKRLGETIASLRGSIAAAHDLSEDGLSQALHAGEASARWNGMR